MSLPESPNRLMLFPLLDGILQVNIIQMTNVQLTVAQAENSLVDFVVTCEGR